MCSFYTTFYFFCSEHTRLTWLMQPLSLLHMAAAKPSWRKCVNGHKMQHKYIWVKSDADQYTTVGPADGPIYTSGVWNARLEFTKNVPPATAFGKPLLVKHYTPSCRWVHTGLVKSGELYRRPAGAISLLHLCRPADVSFPSSTAPGSWSFRLRLSTPRF